MEATYSVKGMTCGGCASAVTRALEALGHDVVVRVSLERAQATIEGQHDERAVQRAIEDAGFDFGGRTG
ncbi:MAG: heavy-metal-associated domain-containing protein [Polyangiaceae bacterium]|nr:heavy-metal-associated domain-containing protein [Polyangiaceae bacterium]